MAEFKDNLKRFMDLRNIKQTELVYKTGIGKSSISQYLSGQYLPKYKNLCLIANVLEVSKECLMGLEE